MLLREIVYHAGKLLSCFMAKSTLSRCYKEGTVKKSSTEVFFKTIDIYCLSNYDECYEIYHVW